MTRPQSTLVAWVEAILRDNRDDAGQSAIHRVGALIAQTGTADFPQLLYEGLSEVANGIDRVRVVATGAGWVGMGIPSFERTLTELIASAQREILIVAYSVTPGSSRVLESLQRAADSGVKCTIVVNRMEQQHAASREMLLRIRGAHPDVSLYDFVGSTAGDELHAKVLVIDRRTAVVGSANLSWHGMAAAHELALVVVGPAAEELGRRVDLLLSSRLVTLMT